MASPNNTTTTVKIQERCQVPPQSPPQEKLSLPLTFFDLFWLRFHPVERIFFYSHTTPHEAVPKLKSSLSLALRHFLPLAGQILWPSDSPKPEIQYNPGDAVSLTVAESTQDFKGVLDNSPRKASESRSLIPELESSDSRASVMSLQITIFPESGLSIGISTHHAVLDGKSSTLFVKAWAHLSQQIAATDEKPSLPPELVPLFDREAIKDPNGLDVIFVNIWTEISSMMDLSGDKRSLKIMSATSPLADKTVRATFELTRGDLEKIKHEVLSKWDTVDEDAQFPRPKYLSTFVLTCAYVSVCISKATEEAQKKINGAKPKFAFGFTADCRSRLDPPVPENYFGNCVRGKVVDNAESEDFLGEHAVVVVAKRIHGKIKELDGAGMLDGIETIFYRGTQLMKEGVTVMGTAGSTRFGVYGADFGWGRPAKVEITSVDKGTTIGMAERRDGSGGVEVGLVLNENVMAVFHDLFHAGL